MERNPNDSFGTSNTSKTGSTGLDTGASALGTGTDSFAVTGQGVDQNATNGGPGMAGGTLGTSGSSGWSDSDVGQSNEGLGQRLGNVRDTAGDKLQQARSMAGERLGQAREKATELKSTLADKLESGANSLRQQGQGDSAQFASPGVGSTATTDNQLARLSGPAADAMDRTAQFLRDGDLKATLETQVRTNPARTLLVALGVGYLIGKALRNDR